jgi:hypothetical protein
MEDRIVKNPDLQAKLEERQKLKSATAAYRKVDSEAKGLIEALKELMPFRIGRFIIAKSKREGRSVAFEVEPSEGISIKTADE